MLRRYAATSRCWFLLACGGALFTPPAPAVCAGNADAPPIAASRAVLIPFDSQIDSLSEQFLYRKLKVAEDDGADVVIIEIDSPGGTVDASFAIAHRLRDLDWAHTIAFVPRRALSGAAVMALGCDQIIMHPSAVLGDVGVIEQGEDNVFRHVPEKIRSHVVAEIRNLATAKRRPAALAEAMVDMNLTVYEVTHRQTGDKSYMTEAEIKSSATPDLWEKGPPVHEAREGHFLEVNGQRAVELKLAEGYARDREELQRLLKLSEKPRVLVTTAVDTAVWILNNPFITGLLFVVGLIALYVELSAPGISIGGLISLLCFALFFWSRFLGGTAELLEVVLFLVGVSFLALEIFVIPGFGFAGIMGILLVLASVVMASQNFVVPTTGRQLEAFATTLLVVTCSGAASLAVAALLSRYFGTLPVFKRLVLQPAVPAAEAALTPGVAGKRVPAPAAGAEVGDWGVALSPLRPAGKARFGDQYLDVITDGAFVDAGRPVRITEICGPRIVVQDVEEM